jgi:hypothetical protein
MFLTNSTKQISLCLGLAILAGCQTAPVPSAAPEKVEAPVVVPVAGPAAAPAAKMVVTEAAKAAAQRLMDGQQDHEMLTTTAFTNYPQFTTENWSGLVLNSKVTTQSLGHVSNFKLMRIEVHPLNDGRIRVWVEFANYSPDPVIPEVACQYNPEDEGAYAKFRALPELAPGKKILTYFESRRPAPDAYSILIRNKRK